MKYEVKNVVSFMGRDMPGYNASLYRDGKKVAFVIDDGNGGCVDIQCNFTERELLDKHVEGMFYPDEKYGQIPMGADGFIGMLVGEYEFDKAMKRRCKTSVCWRLKSQLPDQFFQSKKAFHPGVRAILEAKHGEDLDVIFNERYMK
jgi:hypothetical protein